MPGFRAKRWILEQGRVHEGRPGLQTGLEFWPVVGPNAPTDLFSTTRPHAQEGGDRGSTSAGRPWKRISFLFGLLLTVQVLRPASEPVASESCVRREIPVVRQPRLHLDLRHSFSCFCNRAGSGSRTWPKLRHPGAAQTCIQTRLTLSFYHQRVLDRPPAPSWIHVVLWQIFPVGTHGDVNVSGPPHGLVSLTKECANRSSRRSCQG